MLLELAFKFAFEWSLKNREPIPKAIIDTDTRKNERQKDIKLNIDVCIERQKESKLENEKIYKRVVR